VGRRYKEREDLPDALFCAYLAALVPEGRLEPLGSPERGCILVPAADGTGAQGASRTTRQPRPRRS
jgi:hypothetical protein